MQASKSYRFSRFQEDLAYERFNVWSGPKISELAELVLCIKMHSLQIPVRIQKHLQIVLCKRSLKENKTEIISAQDLVKPEI